MRKKYVKHHNDGTIWAKGTMVDGVPDGYWEWFRKDGSKMRSGYFAKGKQTGKWTTYDRQEKVYKVTNMEPKSKKKR
jgi:antitoxin component YwqK of YwqJK toxin-antitoxin module